MTSGVHYMLLVVTCYSMSLGKLSLKYTEVLNKNGVMSPILALMKPLNKLCFRVKEYNLKSKEEKKRKKEKEYNLA